MKETLRSAHTGVVVYKLLKRWEDDPVLKRPLPFVFLTFLFRVIQIVMGDCDLFIFIQNG